MHPLLKYFQSYSFLKEETILRVLKSVVRETCKKHEILLKPGETCDKLRFIEEGLLRSYDKKDLVSICEWFMFENDFAISINSYYKQVPSTETIQALEKTIVWSIPKKTLDAICRDHPDFLLLVLLMTEKYYCDLAEITKNLRKLTPEEFYIYLQENYPKIISRVPVDHLASFMNIGRTSVYNIRRNLKGKPTKQ